jgi:hypothetical protein
LEEVALQYGGVFHGMDLPLIILHGNIYAEGYKDILTHCVLSIVEDQFSDDDCLYQHNNAPCHVSSFQKWTGQPRVLT